MRPRYVQGTNDNIDGWLVARDERQMPFLEQAIRLAMEAGYWLAPDTVRAHCTLTNHAESLTGAARLRFEQSHVAQLQAEWRAIQRSEKLADWAATGDDGSHAREIAAKAEETRLAERERYAVQRADQLRREEEATAHEKRLMKARAEFDRSTPSKVTPIASAKKGGPRNDAA